MANKRCRLLLVEWQDSCSKADGPWHHESHFQNPENVKCHTVGWVVTENANSMTLASSWVRNGEGEGNRSWLGDITIPKAVILKKRRL